MTGHRTSELPAQAENRMSGFTLLISCMVHRYRLRLFTLAPATEESRRKSSACMSNVSRFPPTSNTAATDPSERRLRGVWLTVARVGSAVIVAFALTLFVASLPITFTQLHFVCTNTCPSGQLTAAQAHSLRQLGVSLGAFATFEIVFAILTSLVWFGFAAVIFWRRSDNLVTLLVAVQLVTQGASEELPRSLGASHHGSVRRWS